MTKSRRGLSVGTKLILVMMLLLAAAVGAGTFYSQRALEQQARKAVKERRADGEASMHRQATLLVRNLITSAALPLAENNFTYLEELAASAQKEDGNIRWLAIRDAHSGKDVAIAGDGAQLAGSAARVDELLDHAGRDVVSRKADDLSIYAASIAINDQVIGSIRLGYSTADFERVLDESLAAARNDAASSARKQLMFAGLVLLAGILLGSVQAYRMTRQLESLTVQAGRIAGGDLRERVVVKSRDEIGLLAHSFNAMADSLGTLLDEVAGKASLERELEIARSVQDRMSPPRDLHRIGPYSVAGRCDMATQCGGDWWSFRELSDGRLLLVVGDVTGHGMSAAMVASTARGALEALRGTDDSQITPTRVLDAMDNAVRGVEANLLMTAFAVLLDPQHGVIEFANAGHCFPYTSSRTAEGALSELGVLAIRGNPLGMPVRSFHTWKRPFRENDVLVLVTDGLTDRVGPNGDRFGDRRYRALLTGSPLADEPDGAVHLRDRVIEAVDRFGSGVASDDDVTIVVCHFHGQREERPRLEQVA